MVAPVSPITGDYFAGRGRLYFRLTGATRVEELGDTDDFTISMENERLERFSTQYGTRTKTDTRLLQQSATAQFTLMQNTARNMAMIFGAEKSFKTQAAATGTYTHNSVATGDILDLGALDVSIVSILGNNTVTGAYTTDNYELDERAGLLKITSIPLNATGLTGIDVKFLKSEITGSAGRLNVGLGSSPDLEGTLIFVGLDPDNNPVEKITLHKVKLAPNGDVNFISDEYRSLPIIGDVIADTTQAAGFYFGQLQDLTQRTNRGQAD